MTQRNKERAARGSILAAIFAVTLAVLVYVGLLVLLKAAEYQAAPSEGQSLPPGAEYAPAVRMPLSEAEAGSVSEAEPMAEAEEEPEELLPADPYAEVEEDAFTRRVEAADPDVVTMAFAGDILFDDYYAIQARIPEGAGISGSVGDTLLAEMNRVDLMVINNEFPYTSRGAPQADKTYTFHAEPRRTSQLKEMGVDLAGIANNHTFDYGEEGLLDTLDTLDAAGIPRVGAGRDIDEASHPMYFLVNGLKIAVVAATQIERYGNPNTRGATESLPGVFRCLDDALLCQRIREAREESDFVVVFIHWGTENEVGPDGWQTKQGPDLAAAGADLIIGAHSHCLQPVTYIDGVPTFYSLGNFLFNSKTLDSCLVECEVERVDTGPEEAGAATGGRRARLRSLRFLPCVQSGCKVRFAEGEERGRILQYMRDISPKASIDEAGSITPR